MESGVLFTEVYGISTFVMLIVRHNVPLVALLILVLFVLWREWIVHPARKDCVAKPLDALCSLLLCRGGTHIKVCRPLSPDELDVSGLNRTQLVHALFLNQSPIDIPGYSDVVPASFDPAYVEQRLASQRVRFQHVCGRKVLVNLAGNIVDFAAYNRTGTLRQPVRTLIDQLRKGTYEFPNEVIATVKPDTRWTCDAVDRLADRYLMDRRLKV